MTPEKLGSKKNLDKDIENTGKITQRHLDNEISVDLEVMNLWDLLLLFLLPLPLSLQTMG